MAVSFDLRKRLGAGYFGEVWLAFDTGLQTERAVKLIPPDKLVNPSNFFQEAQILKAAEHPNVVRVEDTGTMADGRVYVSMEYLPRGSLDDEASGGYVDLTRAKRLMIDVLRGLEHAHRQGILHRDIKPANILIGNNLEGKLSDFGLAVPAGVDPAAIGMKGYMYTLHLAPEVHGGAAYTEQAEIYSCGVTLYRLVNGDSYLPPPSPDFPNHVMDGRYPNRTRYREFIPRPVRMLINKCINVDPAKRFKSVNDLRHGVEQLAVVMNWNESLLVNGVQWTCGHNNRSYQVTRTKKDSGLWEVDVRRGRNKLKLRRVSALSCQDASRAKAEQHTRRVLQDFVLGREV